MSITRKVGKKAATVTPDMGTIEQLLAARGITGVAPEVAAKRFMRFLASDGKLDSMGDVIIQAGWDVKEWLENPAMFADHKHTIEATIARGLTAFVDGAGLHVDCFFLPPEMAPNQLAESCFKLYSNGLLSDCSIGAIPRKTRYAGDGDRAKYGDQVWRIWEESILKELSCVGIGANARAKVEAVAKAFKDSVLNDDDAKAMQELGSDEMCDLVERALFRNLGRHSIQVPPVTLPPPPAAPDFAAVIKSMEDFTVRQEAAAKSLDVSNRRAMSLKADAANGLVLPLTVQDAEAILAHLVNAADENEAAAQIIRTYIPDDSSSGGGDSESDLDEPEGGVPLKSDDGKSLAAELQSVAGKILDLAKPTSEGK